MRHVSTGYHCSRLASPQTMWRNLDWRIFHDQKEHPKRDPGEVCPFWSQDNAQIGTVFLSKE